MIEGRFSKRWRFFLLLGALRRLNVAEKKWVSPTPLKWPFLWDDSFYASTTRLQQDLTLYYSLQVSVERCLMPCGCCGRGELEWGQTGPKNYVPTTFFENSYIEVLGLLFDKKWAGLFDTIDLSLELWNRRARQGHSRVQVQGQILVVVVVVECTKTQKAASYLRITE